MKIRTATVNQYLGIAGAFCLTHLSSHAAINIEKTDGPRTIKVTASTTDRERCGIEISLGDGRVERKPIEPNERLTIQHTYAADGEFDIKIKGVALIRGLRSTTPCEVTEETKSAKVNGAAVVISERAKSMGAEQAPVAAESKPPLDFIIYRRKTSSALIFTTKLDGSRELDSKSSVFREPLQICPFYRPDQYKRLVGQDEIGKIVEESITKALQGFIKINSVKLAVIPCGLSNGQLQFNQGRALPDLIVAERQISDLSSSQWTDWEKMLEVKYQEVAELLVEKRKALLARKEQEAAWSKDLEELAAVDSKEKIGAIIFERQIQKKKPIMICSQKYRGIEQQALLGYEKGLPARYSEKLKLYAAETGISLRLLDSEFNYSFSRLEDFYAEYQKDPQRCDVWIDFPKNLKTLISAVERDSPQNKFHLSEPISRNSAREQLAKHEGYDDLAQLDFGTEISAKPDYLKKLRGAGVSTLAEFRRIIGEIRTTNYSDQIDNEVVFQYLQDKDLASKTAGSSATTIKKARDTKLAEERKAEAARKAEIDRQEAIRRAEMDRQEATRKAEIERVRNIPVTKSALVKGATYQYFSDGSCTEKDDIKCLSKSNYIKMCDFASGITKWTFESTNLTNFSAINRWLNQVATFDDLKISYDGIRCKTSYTLSGNYDGRDFRGFFSGYVSGFLVTSKGDVLVSQADISGRNLAAP